jgi:hypothetical protein
MEEQQDSMDEAQVRKMRLSGDKYGNHTDSWRPVINLKVDRDPMHKGNLIHIRIDESMGHPTQYIELSPDEAEQFAGYLLALVNYIEHGHPDGIEVEEESGE